MNSPNPPPPAMESGTLLVRVMTAGGALPLEGATVSVFAAGEEGTEPIALLRTDLRKSIRIGSALGIVKHIEVDGMPFPLCLCHDPILLFTTFSDSNIVLCDPLQHIRTLTDVDDLSVYLDTIDSSVFILARQSLSL